MRIRKRPVPFPLSSLTPIPLSDPQHRLPLPVQLRAHGGVRFDPRNPYDHDQKRRELAKKKGAQEKDDGGVGDQKKGNINAPTFHPHPPDQINRRLSDLIAAALDAEMADNQRTDQDHQEEEEEEETTRRRKEEDGSNDFGKGGASATGDVWKLSHQPGGGESDKSIPRRKRRSLIMDFDEEEETSDDVMKMKMGAEDHDDKVGAVHVGGDDDQRKKKGVRRAVRGVGGGGAIVEGSRCSRVNGRGWRCCQQTLVGYSLCEHHLGKARLRSMTVVSRHSTTTTRRNANKNNRIPSLQQPHLHVDGLGQRTREHHDHDDGDDTYEKEPVMRIGVIKARSLSSLLCQNFGT